MSNSIRIELDDEQARDAIREWKDAMGEGGMDAVAALTILAEDAMRREAPEGAGFESPSLRDSIDTKPEGRALRKVVQPFKRTQSGWLLVRAIVGNPSTPTYTDERPPVDPLMEWAEAKLGDPSAAWPVRESIFQTGHATFPNEFVDDSMDEWERTVEQVAGQAMREALG